MESILIHCRWRVTNNNIPYIRGRLPDIYDDQLYDEIHHFVAPSATSFNDNNHERIFR